MFCLCQIYRWGRVVGEFFWNVRGEFRWLRRVLVKLSLNPQLDRQGGRKGLQKVMWYQMRQTHIGIRHRAIYQAIIIWCLGVKNARDGNCMANWCYATYCFVNCEEYSGVWFSISGMGFLIFVLIILYFKLLFVLSFDLILVVSKH